MDCLGPYFTQNIELLRYKHNTVFRFLQRQAVVSQLHLTSQYVIISNQPFLFHPPYIMQPKFRFFNVSHQYLMLLKEAEEIHILIQQFQFNLRPVGQSLQFGDLLFNIRLMDSTSDFTALIERLCQINRIIL